MEINVKDFYDYCLSRGDDKYVYLNTKDCALAQYLKSKGCQKVYVAGWHYTVDGVKYPMDENLTSALSGMDEDFASLAERIRTRCL